ncbi:hypothetical protein DLAC_11090 [Tieghemostelium lacteum]|uniref:Transmembrane protein n=1 Tax=Tieghemostelium lacteum TaxID=361077 RepID=A0A151Z357_TIELA|nr:hypothetical protein DLAC_11090 [Tieghemostelium lacteum]|eukprot:KYQ88392.1 hypothetical protein DLAC_11090 [Tieghemostelium lacteum]
MNSILIALILLVTIVYADYATIYYSYNSCDGYITQVDSTLSGVCVGYNIVNCDYQNNQVVVNYYNDEACTSYGYSTYSQFNQCQGGTVVNCTTDLPQPSQTYTSMVFSQDCNQQKYPLFASSLPIDYCYQVAQPNYQFQINKCNDSYVTEYYYSDLPSSGTSGSSAATPICGEQQYYEFAHYYPLEGDTQCQPGATLYTCNP